MRKLLLSFTLMCNALFAYAQPGVVSTFDTLYLPKPDTFYQNTSAPMTDLGFNDALVHFPYYYDTSYGGFWSKGFAYTNKTDLSGPGYMKPYVAATGGGHNGSANYATYLQGGSGAKITFTGAQYYKPKGFYVTNTNYVAHAIKNGYFTARKFGDTTGTNSGLPQGSVPDWFKLTVSGYRNGAAVDTVEFYLADYRFANDNQDYVITNWTWIDLQKLGIVDSVGFALTSSDNDPLYGMNTPAYFSMDDFSVIGLYVAVNDPAGNAAAKVYPNPATDRLFVEQNDARISSVALMDMSGKILGTYPAAARLEVATSHLPSGMYVLQFDNGKQKQSVRFIKQ